MYISGMAVSEFCPLGLMDLRGLFSGWKVLLMVSGAHSGLGWALIVVNVVTGICWVDSTAAGTEFRRWTFIVSVTNNQRG